MKCFNWRNQHMKRFNNTPVAVCLLFSEIKIITVCHPSVAIYYYSVTLYTHIKQDSKSLKNS